MPSANRAMFVALVSAVWACMSATGLAGTIRADRSDSSYLALAAQPVYSMVGEFEWTVSSVGYMASGTLISSQWVLTAAHVVDEIDSGNIGTMTFTLGGVTYHAIQTVYHPGWTGSVSSGNDLGLVKLSSPVSGAVPANLYTATDENRKVVTVVGYGATGTGQTGSVLGSGTKRAGNNVTGLGSVLNTISWTGGGNDNMLVADFDSPGTTGDPTQNLAVPTDMEYCAAPGDSGGGWFLTMNGLSCLAAVTSFLDSYPGNWEDSMYYDIFGATRVSSYLAWIGTYVPAAISAEPGDANRDGTVNDNDLSLLLAHWSGGSATNLGWGSGDFNSDGMVNDNDLSLLLSHWGGGAAAVPEPATAGLLALGGLWAAFRKGRQASARACD